MSGPQAQFSYLSFNGNLNSITTPFYGVTWYGAKGDGVTDDHAAIAAAVAAATAAGGGIVQFPVGTFLNSAAVTVGSNVVLMGAGRGSTIIKQYGSGVLDFSLFTATSADSIACIGITFQGASQPFDTGTTKALFNFASCTNTRIERCRFTGMQGFGAVYANLCTDFLIDGCDIRNSGVGRTTAKFMPALNFGTTSDHSTRVKVVNSHFDTLHFHGIWLQASDSIVSNCTFQSVGESRVVNGGQYNTISNNRDSDGFAVSVTGPFIESFSSDGVFVGNAVKNAGQSGTHFGASQDSCAGIFSAGARTVIADNYVENCLGGGIMVWTHSQADPNSSQHVTVCGNVVINNGRIGNSASGGIHTGNVSAAQPMSDVSFTGNVCNGNQPFDMKLNAPYTNGTVQCRGNTAFPDSISYSPGDLTGTTATTLIGSIPISGNSSAQTAGWQARISGRFSLTSATAVILASYGGAARPVLGGTFAVGDTVTYTLGGHAVTYTVTSGDVAGGLGTLANSFSAAISGDATVGAWVNAVGDSAGGVNITAKAAGWQQGNLTHSVSKSSTNGTLTLNGSQFILNFENYTSAAAPNSYAWVLEISASNVNQYQATFQFNFLVNGTVQANSATRITVDTTVTQSLVLYGTLNNASDSLWLNTLHYSRV